MSYSRKRFKGREGTVGRQCSGILAVESKHTCSLLLHHPYQVIKAQVADLTEMNQGLAKESKTSARTSQAFERLKLELEGAKSANSSLEGQLAELEKANLDLKHQVEKWMRLEGKGEKEAKAKINLQVEKADLEDRLKEMERKDKETSKTLKAHRNQLRELQVSYFLER